MVMTAQMKDYLAASQEELKQLIRDLCAIPAPSHHEQQRAAFCKEWFEKAGGKGVYIDEALNVVCPHHVTEDGPVVVFMAHGYRIPGSGAHAFCGNRRNLPVPQCM